MDTNRVDRKYIFGHDGTCEYWVIADSPHLAIRVAKTKFPSRFHQILAIKKVTDDDYVHPYRVTFGPTNRVRNKDVRNKMLDQMLMAEIKARVKKLGGKPVMEFGRVISFMNQQLSALKNIEDLLNYEEQQNPSEHNIKSEDIEHLKNYVFSMKRAAETAKGLAEYYQKLTKIQTKNKETAEQPKPAENEKPVENKEATEKPKPKRTRKKTAPSAEPAANTPGPNGEQAEQTIIEADAKHETNPAPQVPVANPEPAQPAQQNILDLIASISIDNLQS